MIEWGTAYLGCNGNMTGFPGRSYNYLGIVRTDQPSVVRTDQPSEWKMLEGGILYEVR